MTQSLGSLTAARSVSLLQSLRGRVAAARPALIRFSLTSPQRLRLQLRSSDSRTSFALGQDRNQNGLAERSELLRQVTLGSNQRGTIRLTAATAGTFFVQVANRGPGPSRYQLRLAGASNSVNQTTDPATATVVEQIVQLTNAFRQQNGLAPLTVDSRLSSAAQLHAQNMALQDFVSHTGADGSGIGDRISATGYRWSLAAENIAAGYQTAAAAVQGWIDSPGHRANLLDPQLTQIGVGYYFLANDPGQEVWNSYWTQAFGAPPS
ncbi:MAG: CAP domain-containing protein [Elainella sp.]